MGTRKHHAVMLSSKTHWNNKIFDGSKKAEPRDRYPTHANIPFIVYLYDSDMRKITGEFECIDIIDNTNIEYIAQMTSMSVETVIKYIDHSRVYLWEIGRVREYTKLRNIEEFGLNWPPKTWVYVD
ncbi:MAG: hypothetical protein PHX63_07685 [Eubacteriales bacterium]|nr:hypothetical protein [Eubacteriales bacterium]